MEKQPSKIFNQFTAPFSLSQSGSVLELEVSENQRVDTEIFAYLEYFAEIQENGIKRLREIKKGNGTKKNWMIFRSFVRQAKLFYFSAQEQDPSISALNYFYSFENLVKAYCSLYEPLKVNNKIKHGLSTGNSFADDFSQTITIQKDGVAPLFYKLTIGTSLGKERKITNKKLIPYCTDISFENALVNSSFPRKSLFMRSSMGGENREKMSLVLGIEASMEQLLKYSKINGILAKYFDNIDLSVKDAQNVLKIHLNEISLNSYFQSKKDFNLTNTAIISQEYYGIFAPYVSLYPRSKENRFKLNLPSEDEKGDEIILNECISVFILMFYMSELVRYHPKTIQDNISSPSGWLMERFIINTPQTFLRYMANLISGKDYIFK